VLALGGDNSIPVYAAIGELLASRAELQTMRKTDNIGQLRNSVAALHRAPHRHIAPFANLLLAEVEFATGDFVVSLATVDSVLKLKGESGIGRETGDAYRLCGDLVARLGCSPSAPVVHCYRTAVNVARKQGARALDLRAAFSFARFQQTTNLMRQSTLSPAALRVSQAQRTLPP
jgi:adenylate cyclase